MDKSEPLKAVLSIIDPEYSSNASINKILSDGNLLASSIKLAKRNGLYYYFMKKLKDQNLSISLLFSEQWKEEIQRIYAFQETLKLLNDAHRNSGVSYILIKDCNTIPHVPRDVDIFIRVKEKQDMIQALNARHVRCEHSGEIETTLLGESFLPIDLYTRIVYFGNEFLDEEFLFNSVEEKEIFGIRYFGLRNEAEFMLNLLHCLFGHGYLTLLDFLHLKRIRCSGLSIEFCENYAKDMNWKSVFNLALEKLNVIQKEIYGERKEITFPYLFDPKFIMKCVKRIEGLNLKFSKELLINYSVLIDRIKVKVENSMFYDSIRKCLPIRKMLLSIGYRSRSIRGDKYS